MATSITTHASKGGRLSHAEMDANFANLKSTADGAETTAAALQSSKADANHNHDSLYVLKGENAPMWQ